MDDTRSIDERLKEELDRLPWSALVRHFAFGRVYHVRLPWTVIDAAKVLIRDDAIELKTAMAAGHFKSPSDDDVKTWQSSTLEFEVLVISPFVLIQELSTLH